jgi:hypothetical protein
MDKKPISNLNFSDFYDFPIWTWDDDGTDVFPIIDFDPIPDDNDGIFVKCNFTLHDGTSIGGVITVRMSDHRVYICKFPEETGQFLNIPLQPFSAKEKSNNVDKLCKRLDKNPDGIFPLKYKTPFKFSDGKLLKGKINI